MVRSFFHRLIHKHSRLQLVLLFLVQTLLFLSCTACENPFSAKKPPTHFRLASWNLQAFFDGQEAGTEYADFKAKASWNEVCYKNRLQLLTEALSRWPEPQTRGEQPGPDIIALLEVENAGVLQDLRTGPFARFQYAYSAFSANPASPLGLGILSRFPILSTRSHSLQTASYSTPRPMLEAEIELPGERLFLFVCHWKSKLGSSSEETEALRRSSAELVTRRLHELNQEHPDTQPLVLVVGDLNENADEFERQGEGYLTALMPADRAAETFPEADTEPCPFINISGSPADLSVPASGPLTLYSPWYKAAWPGSYAYQGNWETIDHILMTPAFFNGTGWEYGSFSVCDQSPFVNDGGYPNSFNPRTGTGVSDHLPIMADFYQIQR